jgi:DNA polymerase-3 subunit delta
VPFPPLAGDRVPAWLVKHAGRVGVTLSEESAALIAEAVRGDLAQAVGELDKLASYAQGRRIEPSDVEAVVGVRRGETIGDLLDAVAARNAARAVGLVEPILAQPKTTGVALVMNLTVQVGAMAWGRAARDAGLPAHRLEFEFIRLIRSGGGWPGRPWGEAAKCWAKNLSKWSATDLARALELLVAADLSLKDTRVSSVESVVSALVLSLCTGSGRRAAA